MSDDDKEYGLTTGSLSDRPENSAIKQASPKEGLSTGSLFDRNREKVAKQYAPALSGKEGALAQFDAMTELMRNQIEEYESGKVVSSTGDTSLKGFGQFLTLSSKKPQGRGGSVLEESGVPDPGPWGLIAATGNAFSIRVGNIYTSYASLDSTLTITDADDEFTPAAGDAVWLELTNADTADIEIKLKATSRWAEYPATYKFSSDDVPVVEKSYYMLWAFFGGTMPAGTRGVQITADVYGVRFARAAELVLIWGSHELDDTYRVVPVPVLAPC